MKNEIQKVLNPLLKVTEDLLIPIRWHQINFIHEYLASVILNAGNNLSINSELENWIVQVKQEIE